MGTGRDEMVTDNGNDQVPWGQAKAMYLWERVFVRLGTWKSEMQAMHPSYCGDLVKVFESRNIPSELAGTSEVQTKTLHVAKISSHE